MQQRGGVDELDARGQPEMVLARVAAEPGGREGQHRAQPFAAGRDDVAGELRDERDRTVHPFDDEGVYLRHLAVQLRPQGVQSVYRRFPRVVVSFRRDGQ